MNKVLMEISQIVVENSGGRARLAHQENDTTTGNVPDAAHFIKVDGKRVGRDIELYAFLGAGPAGWQDTLVMFLQEVLIPVRYSGLEESYKAAGERLRQLGHEVYAPEVHSQWDALF